MRRHEGVEIDEFRNTLGREIGNAGRNHSAIGMADQDRVARERVASPALIIVGKVAARADALDCLGAPGVAAQIRDFT